MSFTIEQTAFLNRLNNLLTGYEFAIVERQKHYHCMMLQRIAGTANEIMNTNDYEVYAEVTYYYEKEDGEPIHRYWTSIKSEDNEDGILCTGEDWREGDRMPTLDKPYCYLMHDLVYHGKYEDEEIFKIETIWIDVHIIDQHCLQLND